MTPVDADAIARAAEVLRHGGLVAFPTETVYGLGADASRPEAVRKIFAAKGRPADHPLIVHLAEPAQLPRWAVDIPADAWRLADAFWPGPLTLVLKRRPDINDVVTGGQDTIGLRVPSHPVARALLRAFGGGVAGPSANRFGRISPTTAAHVRAEFGDGLEAILEGGQSEVGIESTIVDLSGEAPAVLRPGHISAEEVGRVLGTIVRAPNASSPRVSGSLESHYAPRTPAALTMPEGIDTAWGRPGAPLGVLSRRPRPPGDRAGVWVTAPADAEGYAHDLYVNLRRLDDGGCERILVEALPDGPDWSAVRDRVGRATAAP